MFNGECFSRVFCVKAITYNEYNSCAIFLLCSKRTLQLPLMPLSKDTHSLNELLGSQEMYKCFVDKYKQTLLQDTDHSS